MRLLADREAGRGFDRGNAGVDLDKGVGVVAPQLCQSRPLLAVLVDILPVVLADRAVRRRGCAGRVLRTAGDTDIVFHVKPRSQNTRAGRRDTLVRPAARARCVRRAWW